MKKIDRAELKPARTISDQALIREAARNARAAQAREAGIITPHEAELRDAVQRQRDARRARKAS